jgi:hypothetical protein
MCGVAPQRASSRLDGRWRDLLGVTSLADRGPHYDLDVDQIYDAIMIQVVRRHGLTNGNCVDPDHPASQTFPVESKAMVLKVPVPIPLI